MVGVDWIKKTNKTNGEFNRLLRCLFDRGVCTVFTAVQTILRPNSDVTVTLHLLYRPSAIHNTGYLTASRNCYDGPTVALTRHKHVDLLIFIRCFRLGQKLFTECACLRVSLTTSSIGQENVIIRWPNVFWAKTARKYIFHNFYSSTIVNKITNYYNFMEQKNGNN